MVDQHRPRLAPPLAALPAAVRPVLAEQEVAVVAVGVVQQHIQDARVGQQHVLGHAPALKGHLAQLHRVMGKVEQRALVVAASCGVFVRVWVCIAGE